MKISEERRLLANFLFFTVPKYFRNKEKAIAQILKYGRWGSCVDCVADEDGIDNADECKYSDRYDHNIASIKNGRIFIYLNDNEYHTYDELKEHLIHRILSKDVF